MFNHKLKIISLYIIKLGLVMLNIEQRTKNISIKTKLLTGFGSVLVILLIISVLSYQALNKLTERFALVNKVQQINLLISEARQQEKNFIMRKDMQYALRAQQIITQAKDLSQESLALLSRDESLENMQELISHVNDYQLYMQRLAALGNQASENSIAETEAKLTTAARASDAAGTKAVERQVAVLQRESDELENIIVMSAVAAVVIALLFAMLITQLVVTPLQKILFVVDKIASGDLTEDLPADRHDEFGKLMQAMQKMSINLRALVNNLTNGISQLAAASEEMAAISSQNAVGVAQQKEETEQVATAMNEMAASVQDVARSAEDASSAAVLSAEKASAGKVVVEKTAEQINTLADEVMASASVIMELQQQSNNIGSVLDVIKTVADQTNLLALNAAIEAARAGEAGRGFSVVADEVRALASRTQESTGQIQQLIIALQDKAGLAVGNMQRSATMAKSTLAMATDAGNAIEQINTAVDNIQHMNQQIASAALQQSTVAEQINRSIFSIRDVAEQSATASEETAAASHDLGRLGTELQSLAAQFRLA